MISLCPLEEYATYSKERLGDEMKALHDGDKLWMDYGLSAKEYYQRLAAIRAAIQIRLAEQSLQHYIAEFRQIAKSS